MKAHGLRWPGESLRWRYQAGALYPDYVKGPGSTNLQRTTSPGRLDLKLVEQ